MVVTCMKYDCHTFLKYQVFPMKNLVFPMKTYYFDRRPWISIEKPGTSNQNTKFFAN